MYSGHGPARQSPLLAGELCKDRKPPGTSRLGHWARTQWTRRRDQGPLGARPRRGAPPSRRQGTVPGRSCIEPPLMLCRARNCIAVPTEAAAAAHEHRRRHPTKASSGLHRAARAGVVPGPPWGIYGKGAAATTKEAAAPFWLLHRVRPSPGAASRRRCHAAAPGILHDDVACGVGQSLLGALQRPRLGRAAAAWSPRARRPCRMHHRTSFSCVCCCPRTPGCRLPQWPVGHQSPPQEQAPPTRWAPLLPISVAAQSPAFPPTIVVDGRTVIALARGASATIPLSQLRVLKIGAAVAVLLLSLSMAAATPSLP